MTAHKNLNFSDFLCIKSIYDLDCEPLLEEGNVYTINTSELYHGIILTLENGNVEKYPLFGKEFSDHFKLIFTSI